MSFMLRASFPDLSRAEWAEDIEKLINFSISGDFQLILLLRGRENLPGAWNSSCVIFEKKKHFFFVSEFGDFSSLWESLHVSSFVWFWFWFFIPSPGVFLIFFLRRIFFLLSQALWFTLRWTQHGEGHTQPPGTTEKSLFMKIPI